MNLSSMLYQDSKEAESEGTCKQMYKWHKLSIRYKLAWDIAATTKMAQKPLASRSRTTRGDFHHPSKKRYPHTDIDTGNIENRKYLRNLLPRNVYTKTAILH